MCNELALFAGTVKKKLYFLSEWLWRVYDFMVADYCLILKYNCGKIGYWIVWHAVTHVTIHHAKIMFFHREIQQQMVKNLKK